MEPPFPKWIAGIALAGVLFCPFKPTVCKRLRTVRAWGVLTVTVLLAIIGDPFRFKNGRHFSPCLGLVPRQRESQNAETPTCGRF